MWISVRSVPPLLGLCPLTNLLLGIHRWRFLSLCYLTPLHSPPHPPRFALPSWLLLSAPSGTHLPLRAAYRLRSSPASLCPGGSTLLEPSIRWNSCWFLLVSLATPFPVLLFSLDSVPFSDPADFLKACLTKNRWPQYSSAASHPWAKETKLTLSKE